MQYLDENKRLVEVKEPWTTFTVYGGFTEPTKQKNFIIVRIPSGRQPWSKKIAPAIQRLVYPWFTEDERRHDRQRSRYCDSSIHCYWNVDGEDVLLSKDSKRLWDSVSAARYEWNGKELVKVE